MCERHCSKWRLCPPRQPHEVVLLDTRSRCFGSRRPNLIRCCRRCHSRAASAGERTARTIERLNHRPATCVTSLIYHRKVTRRIARIRQRSRLRVSNRQASVPLNFPQTRIHRQGKVVRRFHRRGAIRRRTLIQMLDLRERFGVRPMPTRNRRRRSPRSATRSLVNRSRSSSRSRQLYSFPSPRPRHYWEEPDWHCWD